MSLPARHDKPGPSCVQVPPLQPPLLVTARESGGVDSWGAFEESGLDLVRLAVLTARPLLSGASNWTAEARRTAGYVADGTDGTTETLPRAANENARPLLSAVSHLIIHHHAVRSSNDKKKCFKLVLWNGGLCCAPTQRDAAGGGGVTFWKFRGFRDESATFCFCASVRHRR